MDAVDPFEKKEDNTYSSETSEEEDLCKEWKNLTIDDEIEDEEYKRVFNRILELVEENKEYKDIFLVIGKGLTAIQKHMEYLKMTESLPWIKVTSSDWYKNALNLPKEIEAIEESVTQMIKKVKSEQVFEADTTERKVTLRILQQELEPLLDI